MVVRKNLFFVAHKNTVPLAILAEERTRNSQRIGNKLVIEGEKLPDQFHLQDGWVNEEDGVSL